MKYLKFLSTTFLVTVSLLVTAQEVENVKKFDRYTVRYSVFNSTFIAPEIAKAYDIKRSEYESLINIVVNRDGVQGGVPAQISGTVSNLMQQQKSLVFKTIEEENTVYYIAPIRVSGEEIVHFDIAVQPEGESKPLHLKFSKKLYSDSE